MSDPDDATLQTMVARALKSENTAIKERNDALGKNLDLDRKFMQAINEGERLRKGLLGILREIDSDPVIVRGAIRRIVIATLNGA